ncbi:MAG TPA: YHS domain-containing protein [Phycisphaerae bacterium]|nr:YHS domain-containing protein [Phycisphaerae bacterium]
MSDVRELEHRVREKLQAAELRRQDHQEHMRQRMAVIAERDRRFNQFAGPLVEAVIRPRMAILPRLFENAELLEPKSSAWNHCLCVFRHTTRFPATAKLDLGVCPDDAVDSVLLTYRPEILPIYFEFDSRDQLAVPVDKVGQEHVATWVDEKIATFVEAYLRLEHADVYQRENMVKDPVCGMPVNKNWAAATMEHEGHMYYFCIEACRQRFAEHPDRFASSPR